LNRKPSLSTTKLGRFKGGKRFVFQRRKKEVRREEKFKLAEKESGGFLKEGLRIEHHEREGGRLLPLQENRVPCREKREEKHNFFVPS